MNRLTTGERIVAICSGLLVIFSVFKLWATYSVRVLGESQSESATIWDSDAFGLLPKLAILLAIVALVLVGIRASGAAIDLPLGSGILYTALGGLCTLLLLVTLIAGPKDLAEEAVIPGLEGFGELTDLLDIDQSRGIMLYLGLLLAVAMTYGGFLHMKAQGTEQPETEEPGSAPPPAVP